MARKAKITELEDAILREQHVLWLKVTMHHLHSTAQHSMLKAEEGDTDDCSVGSRQADCVELILAWISHVAAHDLTASVVAQCLHAPRVVTLDSVEHVWWFPFGGYRGQGCFLLGAIWVPLAGRQGGGRGGQGCLGMLGDPCGGSRRRVEEG